MSDRELHDRIMDALAAVRFYGRYYSSAGIGADRFKDIIETLYKDGERHQEKLLMEVAVGIYKGYLSGEPTKLSISKPPQDT